ncbi:hypothetical protein Zmor_003384 [Zophobas morio]|uniref:Uncharacterized protein n=1 Tax=Zophobas morio TaxID=2755281 RepID=A0AA38HLC3_9CUCU|nr:hypothetical protein Zmor_003384 [Zophobas morio]
MNKPWRKSESIKQSTEGRPECWTLPPTTDVMVPKAMYDDSFERCLWTFMVYFVFMIVSPIIVFVAIFVPTIPLSIVRRICHIEFESV